MTWTKLGDEFTDECWTLTDAAFRLHVEGLVWSNRKGTDGQLAKDEMRRWARHPEAAEELVAIGWWVDRGQHYEIIHHIGYQRTRAQLAHQSITNRAAANARWSKKKRDKSSNDSHNDSHNDSQCKQDRTGQAWTRRGLNKKNDYSNNGDPWGDPDPDRSDEVPEMYEDDLSDKERAHHEAKADRIVRDGYES